MAEPSQRSRRTGFHDLHARIPLRVHHGIAAIAEYEGETYNTIVRRCWSQV